MRILVGLVTPTTGTATFGDLGYADLPHPQQTVGCVLDARFHPSRSGRNHLRVLAPTAGGDRRVDELLGEVGRGKSPGSRSASTPWACSSVWHWPPRCSAIPII